MHGNKIAGVRVLQPYFIWNMAWIKKKKKYFKTFFIRLKLILYSLYTNMGRDFFSKAEVDLYKNIFKQLWFGSACSFQ